MDAAFRSVVDRCSMNGSCAFVDELCRSIERGASREISGVVNLECCGYSSDDPGSQKYPDGIDIDEVPKHGVEDTGVGNFVGVVSDSTSIDIGKAFFASSGDPRVDLPAMLLAMPLSYEEIDSRFPELLRSDHSAFWKRGLPAVMITDTAEYRNPFYHTRADRIETLDFEFMEKVTRATVLCALRLVSATQAL